MAKRKGKTLIETFAAEQEIACEQVEKIKHIISRSAGLISDEEADEIGEICGWVQDHLRGRRQRLASLVRNA